MVTKLPENIELQKLKVKSLEEVQSMSGLIHQNMSVMTIIV